MDDAHNFDDDDITGLWGPADRAVLAPLIPSSRPRPGPDEEPPADGEHRMRALEEAVAGLAAALEADRVARQALAEQLEAWRPDGPGDREVRLAAIEERVAALDASFGARFEAMARQLEAGRRGQLVSIAGIEADRLDELERQLHDGITSVHRAVNAIRARTAATSDLVALESRMGQSLSRLAEQLEGARAVAIGGPDVEALRHELGLALAHGLSQMRKEILAEVRADMAASRAEPARTPEAAADSPGVDGSNGLAAKGLRLASS